MPPGFLRPRLVRDEVYGYLRDQIVSGDLEAGVWLREQEIANALGVSRTPVREAVNRLAQERLVEVIPNRGVRVGALSIEEGLDIYRVRLMLEVPAVRLAAAAYGPQHETALSTALARVTRYETTDFASQIRADIQFHVVLAEIAGSDTLQHIIRTLNSGLARLKVLTYTTIVDADTRAQHTAIATAIREKDGEAAAAAMQRHLQHYASFLSGIIVSNSVGEAHPAILEGG